MSRILVIGAGGMLSTDLVEVLRPKHDVIPVTEEELDIRDADHVIRKTQETAPDVIVNCAAFTNVDGCEDQRDIAFAVNRDGAGNLADASCESGCAMVHIGTNFVFDGGKSEPYTEDDAPGPLSVYGQSKLDGELEVMKRAPEWTIVRTGWLFGVNGNNFVEKVLGWYSSKRPISVVDDQHGSPSYTVDVSGAIAALIESGSRGMFNASNSGVCSRFDFAKEILRVAGFDRPEVEAAKSSDFVAPATRPPYSALCSDKLKSSTGFAMPAWEDTLVRYFDKRREVRGPIETEKA